MAAVGRQTPDSQVLLECYELAWPIYANGILGQSSALAWLTTITWCYFSNPRNFSTLVNVSVLAEIFVRHE